MNNQMIYAKRHKLNKKGNKEHKEHKEHKGISARYR